MGEPSIEMHARPGWETSTLAALLTTEQKLTLQEARSLRTKQISARNRHVIHRSQANAVNPASARCPSAPPPTQGASHFTKVQDCRNIAVLEALQGASIEVDMVASLEQENIPSRLPSQRVDEESTATATTVRDGSPTQPPPPRIDPTHDWPNRCQKLISLPTSALWTPKMNPDGAPDGMLTKSKALDFSRALERLVQVSGTGKTGLELEVKKKRVRLEHCVTLDTHIQGLEKAALRHRCMASQPRATNGKSRKAVHNPCSSDVSLSALRYEL